MMFELPTFSSGAAWVPAVDAIAKASVILAAAGIVSVLLRRRSAAARHMIWTLALISVLVLPALSLSLPRWQVPLLKLDSSVAPPAAAMAPAHSDMQPPTSSAHDATPRATATALSDSAPLPQPSSNVAATTIRSPNISWPALLVTIWLAGVLLVLGRLAIGIAAVQWMSRRIERVTSAPWLEQARSLARTLGVSPRIVFLRSGRAAMPMAWGIFRPAVLMPADADAWPAERLRIVLLHELAHVKRRDCLTHMLAQIACAFHWFNPLAWIAARHARTERERACDDLVLAAGTRGPDYADELIEIARVMRSGRFPAVLAGASLAMAHRSELEGRLMAILDPQIPRAGVSRRRTVAATAMFALGVMPLAAMQPWTVATSEGAAAAPSAQDATPMPTPRPARAPSDESVASSRAGHINTERAAQTIAASVQSSVQSAVQSSVQTAVQTSVQTNVRNSIHQNVNASIATNVDAAVHSALSGIEGLEHMSPRVIVDKAHPQNAAGDHGSEQGKTADPKMVAALTAALKDTDKDVRETALHALIQMRDPGIFEPLVQALTDVSADVREQAVTGLGQLRDRRAVEPLTNALKDANADVREQAAFALGQLRDRSALPGLTAALKDADEDVREQAVFALGQMRDPASIDALVIAVRDAKANVREQAVFALGQIRDRRAVEPLISALKDTDADVREQAAFALGQIRDRGAVEALVVALKDAVADVREQVAFALGQIRDPRAIDGLTSALKDASADVRQQAAFALGQLAR
jgi:HEAT repeat protein/beta-lactamase regulating signal transducer with metallopeptidase domain